MWCCVRNGKSLQALLAFFSAKLHAYICISSTHKLATLVTQIYIKLFVNIYVYQFVCAEMRLDVFLSGVNTIFTNQKCYLHFKINKQWLIPHIHVTTEVTPVWSNRKEIKDIYLYGVSKLAQWFTSYCSYNDSYICMYICANGFCVDKPTALSTPPILVACLQVLL